MNPCDALHHGTRVANKGGVPWQKNQKKIWKYRVWDKVP